MIRLIEAIYQYALVLVILLVLAVLIAAYVNRPHDPPATELVMALLGTVVAAAQKILTPARRRSLPRLLAPLQVRRQLKAAQAELERLKAELHTERRHRGLEQGQLREAEFRLAEMRQIDRIGAVVAQLEAATAQLLATIPEPRRRRPATKQEGDHGPVGE